MSSALAFLEKVLPTKGQYCVVAFYKNKKGPQHTWYKTKEQLLQQIERLDTTADAVYHACASYGDKKNDKNNTARTKENVQYLRALYCEIDIRTNTDYKTEDEASEGLRLFLKKSKFPCPIIIWSGGGFHFYWPLTADITRDAWLPYAQGLKTYAAKLGFKIDASITADPARILRTPGTTNRKYENSIVELVCDTDPFDIHIFDILLLQNPKPAKTLYEKTPSDPALILTKCNQLRILRDNPTQQDGLTWIATANLLAQCTGGEQLFHEWSSKDPRYNADEANKKWGERLKFNNASTCARFEEVNPNGCTDCPFKGKIRSPIVLGRDQQYKLPDEVSSVLIDTELPRGFKFDANGKLMFVTEKQSTEGQVIEKVTYLTEFPLIIEDKSFSEESGSNLTIAIKHWKPYDGWTLVHIRANELFKNCEVALSDVGIFTKDVTLMKRFINESTEKLSHIRRTSMSYETLGWKENAPMFLWGDRLYRYNNGQIEFTYVTLSGTAKTLAENLRPGGKYRTGSLEGWQAVAQTLFAPGHEWQACTVLAGFAAVLMSLCMPAEGGLIWSTYEQIGAQGKSLATLAGCSIWGDPHALSTTSSDTAKARMGKLGALRHFPYGFDEMKRTDEKIVKTMLQEFTMGSQGSGLKQNRQLMEQHGNWCTIMLTSSNQELMSVLDSATGSKAMKSRVFEVHASELPLSKKELKESFKKEFLRNCGHVGEVYIKSVVYLRGTGELEKMIQNAEIYFTSRYNFGPEQRFKLAFFKAMYVAAQIVSETGILNFTPETQIDWLIAASGHVEKGQWIGTEREDMVDILSEYLHSSIRNTIVVNQPFVAGKNVMSPMVKPTEKMTIRRELTGQIMLDKGPLRDWLRDKKDVSVKHFLANLKARKLIVHENIKKGLGAGTEFSCGQTWCIVINGKHELIKDVEDNVINIDDAKKQQQLD